MSWRPPQENQRGFWVPRNESSHIMNNNGRFFRCINKQRLVIRIIGRTLCLVPIFLFFSKKKKEKRQAKSMPKSTDNYRRKKRVGNRLRCRASRLTKPVEDSDKTESSDPQKYPRCQGFIHIAVYLKVPRRSYYSTSWRARSL